jgi:hypothetical protein
MGAVNTPADDICPALVDHDTAALKLPVPITVAEQVLFWPDCTVEGEQATITEVMVA